MRVAGRVLGEEGEVRSILQRHLRAADRLHALGVREPAQEVIEAAVFHRYDDDMFDPRSCSIGQDGQRLPHKLLTLRAASPSYQQRSRG